MRAAIASEHRVRASRTDRAAAGRGSDDAISGSARGGLPTRSIAQAPRSPHFSGPAPTRVWRMSQRERPRARYRWCLLRQPSIAATIDRGDSRIMSRGILRAAAVFDSAPRCEHRSITRGRRVAARERRVSGPSRAASGDTDDVLDVSMRSLSLSLFSAKRHGRAQPLPSCHLCHLCHRPGNRTSTTSPLTPLRPPSM